MKQKVQEEISRIINKNNILWNEPMAAHTTFRVGGVADCFLLPQTEEEAAAVLRLFSAEKEPFFVLGNGSNLLVSDEGYRGTVIKLGKNFNAVTVNGTEITAKAGALLSRIAQEACTHHLSGLEFASGIPGTLGGAVVMNAGAYGGEMKQVITSVRLFSLDTGEIIEKEEKNMEFGYRTSIVKTQPYYVLEASLKLLPGSQEQIKSRMEELKKQRVEKQPLEFPSAGSTFKRPEGYFAGKLIQDAGLKGYCVGGAMVSEKHSGFVINTGNATAKDICELIRNVRKRVFDQFGVMLEPEVCMLGEGMSV